MKAGKILIILLSISINLILYATEQESDYIKINDIEHKLFTNPINQLLQFEDFHNQYITVVNTIKNFSVSSACWRGYTAYFEIKNDLLYLYDIIVHTVSLENIGNPENKDISIYSKLFDSKISFFCDFYSGVLIIPAGECIKEIYSGYDSIYENYLIIKIHNGQVVQKKEFKYNELEDRKMEAFKKYKLTEKYKTDFSEAKKIFTVVTFAEELDNILYKSDELYLYDYFSF